MAMPVQPLCIGVDVSRDTLVLCTGPDQTVTEIDNQPDTIQAWLAQLPTDRPLAIALEATGIWHLPLAEQAHRAGHPVYLIDGYRLVHYRHSLNVRAKTDRCDAQLLARYLAHEYPRLRPWSPPPAGYLQVWQLLRRRAVLVRARVALQQSLKDLKILQDHTQALWRQIQHIDRLLVRHITQALRQHGWHHDARRCQAIEGVGPLTAAALTTACHRGQFQNSDAFIAFLGLDLRPHQSGTRQGRRRLSKKGDPELRRLLFLAAMQAARSATWRPLYQRYLDRGLARIQALVILARKIARIAFALIKNQTDYQPKTPSEGCNAT